MAYFPLFVELEGERCLLVGGGPVALRKAKTLLAYGAQVVVTAPELLPELAALPGAAVRRRPFEEADLTGARLVVAATDDRALNERIGRLCRERAIPVNVADSRADSTFLFPSVVRRGPLSVGITTGGASPTAARYARQAVEAALPEAMGEILDDLDGRRAQVQRELRDAGEAARAQTFAALFDACMKKGGALSEEEYAKLLADAARPPPPAGKVWLVGAGCGGADWITLQGARLLRRCDAVVYDALAAPELLAFAPARAERILAGKRGGQPSARQAGINETLIRLARQGKTVVRLKGGDPFVFGRGGEEIEALQAAGVPFEEVPGISSAVAIPAQAGIPLTHRRVSRSFTVVTGRTADGPDSLPEEVDTLAALRGTVVVLMGLAALPRLTQRLLAAGKPPRTPAAVVSGGNAPRSVCVRGTLADIAEKTAAAGVESPAVIVIGDVAALDFAPK